MKKISKIVLCLLVIFIALSSFTSDANVNKHKVVVTQLFILKPETKMVSPWLPVKTTDFYAVTFTLNSLGANNYNVTFDFYEIVNGVYTPATYPLNITVTGQADGGTVTFSGIIPRHTSSGTSNNFSTTNPMSVTTTSVNPSSIGAIPIYLEE